MSESQLQEHESARRELAVVVNDDRTQLTLLGWLLRHAGLDVRCFSDSESALAAFGEGVQPDVVITDIYMSGIDGWRFCQLLRSHEYPSLNKVPVLVVSAIFSGSEVRRIATELGANAFLAVPVDGRRFVEKVRLLLRGEKPDEKPRVLIVEDSRSLAEHIKKGFEGGGYHAEAVLTGRAAADAFAADLWDIVLIDYYLPDMMGDQLLTDFMRQRPDAVCVMMTTDSRPELALAWIKAGAAAYLQKPFMVDYLLAVCDGTRRQRALLSVQDRLEVRTRELRESEEKYRELVESIDDVIFAIAPSGLVSYISPALFRLAGYQPVELVGKPFESFFYVDDGGLWQECRQSLVVGAARSIELRMVAKSGKIKWVQLSCRMTPGASGDEIAGRLTDITDKRLAQVHADALARADKMISLGILVSGMAHEINNPNNFIMLNGGLVAESWQDVLPILEAHYQAQGDFNMAGINYSVMRDDLPKLMAGIQEGSERIKRIIDDLTRFSRMEPPDLSQKVDVNKVVAAAISLLGSLIKRSPGCFRVEYDESIPCVYGSSQRIEQVVINLVQNACQSLRESSQGVTVTTVRPSDGSGVIIKVEDDGCGISDEHLKHITDPFYTTKRVAGGVGLGLSVSAEIVREHGGELTFTSVVGKGTIATVTLPLRPVSA